MSHEKEYDDHQIQVCALLDPELSPMVLYQDGYNAFLDGDSELANPYTGIEAEYWSDGWQDAQEDEKQRDSMD